MTDSPQALTKAQREVIRRNAQAVLAGREWPVVPQKESAAMILQYESTLVEAEQRIEALEEDKARWDFMQANVDEGITYAFVPPNRLLTLLEVIANAGGFAPNLAPSSGNLRADIDAVRASSRSSVPQPATAPEEKK